MPTIRARGAPRRWPNMKHLWMRWVSQQRKLFKVGPGHRMSMVVGSNSLRPLRFGHLALNYELHHPATRDYKNAVVVKPQIHDCLCCLWLHPEETGILCDSERVAVWCYYRSFLRGRDSFNRFFQRLSQPRDQIQIRKTHMGLSDLSW